MKIVFDGVKIATMLFLIGLLSYVLGNAARLEQDYMGKYEAMYNNLVMEHEQQMIIGECIQSQQSWERAADALRLAYAGEQARAHKIEKQLQLEEYELYVFMKFLERDFPGVAAQVLNEINSYKQQQLEGGKHGHTTRLSTPADSATIVKHDSQHLLIQQVLVQDSEHVSEHLLPCDSAGLMESSLLRPPDAEVYLVQQVLLDQASQALKTG